MPEQDASNAKEFYPEIPQADVNFRLKGSSSLDWGMKNRLSNIFDSKSGKTVMLAIDHGYFQGPTTGLERIDINIVPLLPFADTLMVTRGILRSLIPPTFTRGVVLRTSGGPKHSKGIVERADRSGHGGCDPLERLRDGRSSLHWRRTRKPVRAQSDASD